MVQEIDDLLDFFEESTRTRGGLAAAEVLAAAGEQGMFISPDLDREVLQAELDYRMDLQEAHQQRGDRPVARPHTVRWYTEKADEKISADAKITVRQACFCLAALKLRGGMTVKCFDGMCKLIAAGGFLPPSENAMPRCPTNPPLVTEEAWCMHRCCEGACSQVYLHAGHST